MLVQQSVPISPADWSVQLSGAPVLDRSVKALTPAVVRRWRGIDPDIDQAALDCHCISIHLGGPKRLSRQGEGRALSSDTSGDAYSVIPAGSAFRWQTQGPVDFAHIYFTPATISSIIGEVFDRDPTRVFLRDALGDHDPLIATLAQSLISELEKDDSSCAYLDQILHLLASRVVQLHSDVACDSEPARHTLAPFRLRRAIDFIESNIGQSIGVTEIAAASGISPYHFSRAFRLATGLPPYSYLMQQRIGLAKDLLKSPTISINAVAQQCGFANLGQFSRAFHRETGVSPTNYRRGL